MVAQIRSREKIFLTISFSSCTSKMIESEWFSDVPNGKKLVTMYKVTFSLKDVGIVNDLRGKWPRAIKRFAQRYTAG